MSDPLRVIQWYTGDIAQHQIRLVTGHPSMELVGAFVHHDEKVGRDAGEIAVVDPLGVTATNRLDEILAVDADCVLYNPPTERYNEIIPILASGKNVISIMGGWHPHQRRSYPDILAACEEGESSLFGTGLNPGLSYELALLASSCCSDIESITIKTCERQSTLSPVFLEMFGFGKTREELAGDAGGAYAMFRNLHQITDLLCEELGLPNDGHAFTHDFEPATKDYDQKVTIRKGTMAGLIIRASTTLGDVPVATVELRFLLGTDYVSPQFLAEAPATGWIEVDVKGTPGSRLTHELYADEKVVKTRSTGTRAVNAVPFVCEARPGVLSPLDLPLARMLRRD